MLACWKAAAQEGVECLVAPFEADAQLAYLARTGYVAAVVTEDSDLLAFGTQKVLYKMNDFGEARLMVLDEILGHKKGKLDLVGVNMRGEVGRMILGIIWMQIAESL